MGGLLERGAYFNFSLKRGGAYERGGLFKGGGLNRKIVVISF